MAWMTNWAVTLNGRPASNQFNTWLQRIEVQLREEGGGDTADLGLDDTAGLIALPPAGTQVSISLNGAQVFEGFTEVPEWRFARGQGRAFVVHCVAHDSRASVKDPQHWHQDGGTLKDFLTRAAKEAGLTVKVAPAFANIKRQWWSPDGAGFLQVGQMLASDLGGVFRIRGGVAVLAERGSGASAGGVALGSVVFDCNSGLVRLVQARPFAGEQNRSRARHTWFDRRENRWKSEDVEIEPLDGAPDSMAHGRFPRADANGAREAGRGRRDEAQHHKGSASVESDLLVTAVIGAPALILNARPGVDGAYTIKSIRYRLDRSGGGSSEFDLARPDGAAGKDSRAKSTSSGSAVPGSYRETGTPTTGGTYG